MFRYLPIVLSLFLIHSTVSAQNDSVLSGDENGIVEQQAPPVARQVELRSFDPERIAQLRSEYDYDREILREPTLWERFKQWVEQRLSQLLGTRAGALITRNLVYLIIIIVIVFALVMLSRTTLQRVFHGKPRSQGEVAVTDEDIREMDLDKMIEDAERAGDLRLAIRLHYLLVLRKLVDRGILAWHPYHTDQDYMAQISDPVLRSRFAHVALVFQWVWYGNAGVAPARYDDLRRPFIEFESSKAA
jgi:hypothetical protein